MGYKGQSVTLANSIIGVGILAMPFCFQQCGVVLATLILISMGLVSRLCCHFLLKSAIITRRRNFEFLAFHVFGPSGKMAVEVGIIGFLMGTCIAYFVVVGDLGPQIIAKLLNINQSDILRTSIMVIVSLVCVLPLGLLRNVDSLSNVSAATICFYFCLVIKVIVEASSQLLTADWHTRIEMWKPSGILQCVPIISMALFCQTQLFEIFESMPSLSLEKMNLVTKNAINICSAVYFTLGIFGYVAFGSKEISGNILMSLSPTMASDVIKLGFVMSLAFSFPLIIFPCRASLYSFLYRKPHSSHHDHIINHSIPESTFRCITVCIIACALAVSLLVPSVELVLGLAGSTIGACICVLFPAACFLRVTFKDTSERLLAKVVLVFGLIILVLGTYANLEAAENTRDKYDDRQITQERIDKMVEDFFEKRGKADGVMEQPQMVIDTLPKINMEKINGVIKDSEFQPPNPIPPESNSNENKPVVKVPELKEKEREMLKEALPQVVKVPKVPIDKASETDLQNQQENKLNEAKISNGADIVEKPVIKSQEKEVKQLSSQEKSDIQKQQQLMETIKQHGEEQKELMQEQNKILDEIMKTKKELQENKNKKEVDSVEAKKIAVESIQKIANMAIQSLGGVTDKPIKNIIKEKEPIQKIADEAVHEIAKIAKVAKVADAIKEIEDNKHHVDKVQVKNEKPDNVQVVNNVAPKEEIPVHKDPPVMQSINYPNPHNSNNNVNSNVNNANAQGAVGNTNQQGSILSNINQNIQTIESKPIENKFDKPANINQNIQTIESKPAENKVYKPVDIPEIPLKHSHSPDEPQSYKRGEDAQNNIPQVKPSNDGKASIPQNVPIPIALRDSSNNVDTQPVQNINKRDTQENQDSNNIVNKASDNLNVIQNGAVPDTLNNNVPLNKLSNDNLVRQKRDVDCLEKEHKKLEEHHICENQKTPETGNPKEILKSDMNLNDIGLPNSLPVQQMAINHMRSLKSYDENEKRR